MPQTIRSARHELLVRRFIEARKASGLTQADLAARFGRHQPFIANIESGQRRIDLVELIDLAGAIGLNLHLLVDELNSYPIEPSLADDDSE